MDYNDRLFEEIRSRTQGADEPMGIYLAVMDNLFDRLTVNVPEGRTPQDYFTQYFSILSKAVGNETCYIAGGTFGVR